MSRSKRLSPYYFIIFVVITALILAWFFSRPENSENININANANTNINARNANTNQAVKINENINQNINMETEMGGSEEEPAVNNLGIQVKNYTIEKTTASSDITNLHLGGQNNVSIMPESYEGIIKNSISIKNQENIAVDGISGVKYTGGSAKDGTVISFILVKTNGKLYYFKGNEEFLNNLNNNIKFE